MSAAISLVPTSVFDGVDYAALGHLHGRHTLTDSVRYSGSPLAYSFSEATHRKGSWLVDLGADGLAGAEFVDAPVPRPLARISGDLDALLADPGLARHEGSWLQVTLTDAVRPVRAMERLRQRFPHTLVLGFASSGTPVGPVDAARTAGRSDHDIACDFVSDLRGAAPTGAESTLLRDAIDACCVDPEADTLVGTG